MKWILLVLLGLFIIRFIQVELRDARKRKRYDEEVGRTQKKKRGIKNLDYVAQCFEKGQKEKGIAALEAIAAQEGNLEEELERYSSASALLHLALLGTCEVEYFNKAQKWSKFTIEMPEYKSREKAEQIAGWLLQNRQRQTKSLAFQYNEKHKDKMKPEDYHNHVYFLLALLDEEGERFTMMKQAAEFKSDEARWWLLRNGMFEKAFPDPEQQKEQYYELYYAMKWKNLIWEGDTNANLSLQKWMIREGGFPEELLNYARSKEQLQEKTALNMREDVIAALMKLKKKGSSVGTDTLLRIEKQDGKDKEELINLIEYYKLVHETAAEFNQMMEEDAAFHAEKEAEAAGDSGASGNGFGNKFNIASMPAIVYDSGNRQWKRRGIYGDHAVYENSYGGEVTIYSAQVSSSSANTSAGIFHW